MAKRNRLFNWFRSIWNMYIGDLEDGVPQRNRLETEHHDMERALDARADSAAFAMATATETRRGLEKVLSEHDAYKVQAERYLSGGDESKARQSLFLAQKAEKEIVRLTAVYDRQRHDADEQAATFAREQREVQKRASQMSALADMDRITASEEKFSEAQGQYNLATSVAGFDEIAGGIERRREQVSAKRNLTRDPEEEVKASIDADREEDSLNSAFQALKAKIANDGVVSSEELLAIEHQDAASMARDLLNAPRLVEFQRTKVLTSSK